MTPLMSVPIQEAIAELRRRATRDLEVLNDHSLWLQSTSAADQLERVLSGEVRTPELEALAKIEPQWLDDWAVCPFCRVVGKPIPHADDCVWVRARAICGDET